MKHPHTIGTLACIAVILFGATTNTVNAACAIAVTAEGCMAYVYGEETIENALKRAINLAWLGGKKKSEAKIIFASGNGGYGAVAGWIGPSGEFAFGGSSTGIMRLMAAKKALEDCSEQGGKKPALIKGWFDFVGLSEDMIPESERGSSRAPGSGILNAEAYKGSGKTLEGN